jgi:hypothetical protein
MIDLLDQASGLRCRLVPATEVAAREEELARVAPGLSGRFATLLGLHRPELQTNEHGTLLVLFTVDADLEPVRWVLAGSADGVLVVGDAAQADELREVLAHLHPTSGPALLRAVVLALAKTVPPALDAGQQLVDETQPGRRVSRAARRRELRGVRARLFTLRERLAAQSRLLEELREGEDHDARRTVRRAQSDFDAGSSTAAGLYALAGDELNEESAMVNERLTLVSTLFLPATVTTGFFGMNFGWMVNGIGSMTAFLTLGVLTLAAVSLVTLVLITRLGAGRD